MTFPDKETVDKIREEYPVGTRIILEKMDDEFAPPIGTLGTVTGVDDVADLLVSWDNGLSLKVIYGHDQVKKMVMTDKVFRQIMDIRDSGLTNMYDINMVQRLAYERDYFELVNYIEENKGKYVHFISYGREED